MVILWRLGEALGDGQRCDRVAPGTRHRVYPALRRRKRRRGVGVPVSKKFEWLHPGVAHADSAEAPPPVLEDNDDDKEEKEHHCCGDDYREDYEGAVVGRGDDGRTPRVEKAVGASSVGAV